MGELPQEFQQIVDYKGRPDQGFEYGYDDAPKAAGLLYIKDCGANQPEAVDGIAAAR